MNAILHKLCEKSEQELWELLKNPDWSKDHAEVAYYMVEIMKAVKKIEHLENLEEAMEEYDEQGGNFSNENYARGGRGRRARSMYEWHESPPIVYNFGANGAQQEKYYEQKYKELLEEKWEKERREKTPTK